MIRRVSRRAIFFAAGAIAAVACSDEYHPFDPPLLGDAKSLVLVFELPDPRAFALDASDEDLPVMVKFDGGAVPVYAVLYDQTLADLGFERGELGIDGDGIPLPDTPRPIQRAIVGEGTRQPWTDVELPLVIRELRVKGDPPDLCTGRPQFVLETHMMETRTNGRDAIELEDGKVLIAAEDGTFYRIGAGVFARETVTATIASLAMYRAPDGALWRAGPGVLIETRDGVVTRSFPTTPATAEIRRLAGVDNGNDPFELLALDFETAALFRFSGAGEMAKLEEINRSPGKIDSGDVAWIAPGKAYAALSSRTMLTVIDGAQIDAEDVNLGNIGILSMALRDRGREIFIGTAHGHVKHKEDGRWDDLGDLQANVGTIAFYEDGVAFAGKNGQFGFWSKRTGFCREQLLPGSVEKLLVVGGDIVAAMNSDLFDRPEDAAPPYVTWMRRMR